MNDIPEKLIRFVCDQENVKGKQCTTLWHVDDLNMSHGDSDIIYSVLSVIGAEYGKIVKMIITPSKIHKYPGMTISYSLLGKEHFLW